MSTVKVPSTLKWSDDIRGSQQVGVGHEMMGCNGLSSTEWSQLRDVCFAVSE